MRGLVLLLSSALLLCGAAPADEPLTCSAENEASAANLAMTHINQHHDHGYKFRLRGIREHTYKEVEGGCDIELQLDLAETKCHVVNPKNFTECDVREEHKGAVIANCTVLMTIRDDDAKITEHKCLTRRALTPAELVRMCPDCPTLGRLNNPKGVEGAMEALQKINDGGENSHIYALKEMGRQNLGSVMGWMQFYIEFAIVQTPCKTGTRIAHQACKPLCPDRASHALCHATLPYDGGVVNVDCEYYPASNTTALAPGEQEPVCVPEHVGDRGPPPHAGGPPPHAGGHGPPPHAGGPPPHAGGHGPPPHAGGPPPHAGAGRPPPPVPPQVFFESVTHCPGFLTALDPAIHPICPWRAAQD